MQLWASFCFRYVQCFVSTVRSHHLTEYSFDTVTVCRVECDRCDASMCNPFPFKYCDFDRVRSRARPPSPTPHTHTRIHARTHARTHTKDYICVCVCVCVWYSIFAHIHTSKNSHKHHLYVREGCRGGRRGMSLFFTSFQLSASAGNYFDSKSKVSSSHPYCYFLITSFSVFLF